MICLIAALFVAFLFGDDREMLREAKSRSWPQTRRPSGSDPPSLRSRVHEEAT